MSDPRGAPDTFEQAVLPCLDDAYAVARYLLRDDFDAQDAVQDAFLRALRYYDPGGIGDVRAWLLTIVRRCCYDQIARRKSDARTVPAEPALAAVPDPGARPDAAASASSLRRVVEAALESLPPDHREILVLREVQQLSYREISQVVGLPMGTVMSRLSRARRGLQQALAGVWDAEG